MGFPVVKVEEAHMLRRLASVLLFAMVFPSWVPIPTVAQSSDGNVNLLLSTLPGGKDPQRYKGYVEPKYKNLEEHSLYVTMRDGVKIAVTIALPNDPPLNEKIPAIMNMTRYWRAQEGQDLAASSYHRFLCLQGYALVLVDARGTGASFGVWRAPFSQDEIKDYDEVVDWIVKQPWSNGKIGALGNSYEGNTAVWLAVNKNPAIKAVIPRHYEFDLFAETPYPGGLRLADKDVERRQSSA
jgi:predicted acyl esterase